MTFEAAIEHLRQLKVVSLNEQPEECSLMYGEALNAIEELRQRYERVSKELEYEKQWHEQTRCERDELRK